jgi:uncharacterized membrane protein YagU involved in acid resistance
MLKMSEDKGVVSVKSLIILYVLLFIIAIVLEFLVLGASLESLLIIVKTGMLATASIFLTAVLIMPISGMVNRIKKRPYFYKWSNVLFWASIICTPFILLGAFFTAFL